MSNILRVIELVYNLYVLVVQVLRTVLRAYAYEHACVWSSYYVILPGSTSTRVRVLQVGGSESSLFFRVRASGSTCTLVLEYDTYTK